MRRGLQGRLLTMSIVEEKVAASMPSPLPPVPALQWCGDLQEKYERAALHLGQLDIVAEMLPDTSLNSRAPNHQVKRLEEEDHKLLKAFP